MESTLALKLSQLESAVGDYLGYGLHVDDGGAGWDDQPKMQFDITKAINTGLNMVYRPGAVPGVAEAGYQWSWLKPYRELTLPSGQNYLDLPDDFSNLVGPLVVSLEGGSYGPIDRRNISLVNLMHAQNADATGAPDIAALHWVPGTSLKKGQRARLTFFPTPDDDYTIGLTYTVLGEALTAANPYPLGGAAHAETIQAACIAAAELYRDDKIGERHAYFMQRLAASILEDQNTKPQLIGYNGDASDAMAWGGRRTLHGWSGAGVTFDDVEY